MGITFLRSDLDMYSHFVLCANVGNLTIRLYIYLEKNGIHITAGDLAIGQPSLGSPCGMYVSIYVRPR